MNRRKKPFYGKVWFLLFAFIFLVGIMGACSDSEIDDEASTEVSAEKEESVTEKEEEPESAEDIEETFEDEALEKEELSREEEIEQLVDDIVADEFNATDINKIDVNLNMGLDDGTYIVLPHLIWNVKNRAEMTRDMLKMYSDHLAAVLADEDDISEITVFWEVPYHLEGDNIAKYMYERSGDDMAIEDVWHAPIIRE